MTLRTKRLKRKSTLEGTTLSGVFLLLGVGFKGGRGKMLDKFCE